MQLVTQQVSINGHQYCCVNMAAVKYHVTNHSIDYTQGYCLVDHGLAVWYPDEHSNLNNNKKQKKQKIYKTPEKAFESLHNKTYIRKCMINRVLRSQCRCKLGDVKAFTAVVLKLLINELLLFVKCLLQPCNHTSVFR